MYALPARLKTIRPEGTCSCGPPFLVRSTLGEDRAVGGHEAFKALGRIGDWSIDTEIIGQAAQNKRISARRKGKIRRLRPNRHHFAILAHWRHIEVIRIATNAPRVRHIRGSQLAGTKRHRAPDAGHHPDRSLLRGAVHQVASKYNEDDFAVG
jgi:hypothetical protein